MAGGNVGGRMQTKLKGDIVAYPVKAAARIYRGTMVQIDTATGYAVQADDASSRSFVGVSEEEANNTDGSSADIFVRVRRRGIFRFKFEGGSAPATVVGKTVSVAVAQSSTVDELVNLSSSTSNASVVGMVTAIDAADDDYVFVDIAPLNYGVVPLAAASWMSSFWSDCTVFSTGLGMAYIENWANGVTGYTATQATAGTFAMDTTVPLIALADCNSVTQHQGINVQRTYGPTLVPATGSTIYFEAEIKVVDTYDKVQLLVGLATVDTTALPSGALSNTTNVAAFEILTTAAGALTFAHQVGGTGGTSGALSVSIAEDTYIKLGFKITANTSGTVYTNGTANALALTAADLPTGAMVPTFVCQTDGTNDPILHIKRYAVAQTVAA